jgi:hypothetical protein
MSQARIEILRLISEGKITPEEGDRLLRALDGPTPSGGAPGGDPPGGGAPGYRGWADGLASVMQEVAETVRRTAEEAVGAAHRIFEETRPGVETVSTRDGSFDVPAGARLRIQHAIRVSLGGGSKGSDAILRSGSADRVRIVRGEALEVHRNENEYVLTWAKGPLELEIPARLAALDVRCMGGDLEIQDFPGPMALDTMGGELRVRGPRMPFRFRTLGGKVRVTDLDLREEGAVIGTTGGDVQIEVAQGASLTIRVSTLGGSIEFPPGTERNVQSSTRRRATCVIGQGTAELKVDTLGGDIRVGLA